MDYHYYTLSANCSIIIIIKGLSLGDNLRMKAFRNLPSLLRDLRIDPSVTIEPSHSESVRVRTQIN